MPAKVGTRVGTPILEVEKRPQNPLFDGSVAGITYVLAALGGGQYTATQDAVVVMDETDTGTVSALKTILDALKAANVTFSFTSGQTFSFITDAAGVQDHATFNSITGLTFNATTPGSQATLTNTSTAAADTEPLSFTSCNETTVKDLIISAGGSERTTSDALDFDDCSDCVVDNVTVTLSRARGIVFDGKDPGAAADRNVIQNCTISGCPSASGDGIELLGAQDNVIDNCTIQDNVGHGIQIVKGSGASGRKSNGNTVKNCTIRRNGRDGINILSSDANIIGLSGEGNTILDNAYITSTKDGVRIETTDAVAADDNVIEYNEIHDTRSKTANARTQDYGVDIRPALATEANRTIVRNNNLLNNKTGTVNDGGTSSTISGNTTTDSGAPTQVTGLTLVSKRATEVTVSWDAATDPEGSYIDRYQYKILAPAGSGVPTTLVNAPTLQGTIRNIAGSGSGLIPNTQHEIRIRARDNSDNNGADSASLLVTTDRAMIHSMNPDPFQSTLNASQTQGWEFTVGASNLTVQGFKLHHHTAIAETIYVWAVSGETIVGQSLTFTPTAEQWSYVDIDGSPFVLTAGANYVITIYRTTTRLGNRSANVSAQVTFSPDITFVRGRWKNTGGLVFPDTSLESNAINGVPDIIYTI